MLSGRNYQPLRMWLNQFSLFLFAVRLQEMEDERKLCFTEDRWRLSRLQSDQLDQIHHTMLQVEEQPHHSETGAQRRKKQLLLWLTDRLTDRLLRGSKVCMFICLYASVCVRACGMMSPCAALHCTALLYWTLVEGSILNQTTTTIMFFKYLIFWIYRLLCIATIRMKCGWI